MSRTYFKNDLYYTPRHQEIKQKKKTQTKDKKEPKTQKQENPHIPIIETDIEKAFQIKFVQNKKKEEEEDQSQLLKLILQRKQKKPSQTSEKISTKKSLFYTPKSTLIQPIIAKPEQEKQLTYRQKEQKQKKQRIEMWKMKKDLKKNFNFEKEEKEKEQQRQKQKQKQKEESDESSEGSKKKGKKSGKKKKIHKQENFVRINLKQKYKDKFVGALNRNLRQYTRNGRLKSKYKKATELELTEGQLYNSYIISLSKALYFTIDLEEQSQIQNQRLNYTVPTQFNRETLTKLISELFGFQRFREGQYETITNMLQNKSTLFVSETASGKSLTYILSSVIMKGLSIVVSPLVSLMLDQLQHLPSDLPAACISSLLTRQNKQKILQMVKKGKIQLLFVTPESLLTDFMYHVSEFPPINFVCIDEAHSLSELSHSFRASYLSLVEIVLKYFKYKSGTPVVLCLTATANIQTMDSIMKKLQIKQKIRSKTIINKNLYITISREQLSNKYQALLKYLMNPNIIRCRGILIYCRTKKIMFQVHNYLRNSSLNCCFFHSGLSQKQKTDTMANFRNGDLKIVISTVALGMGLDFQNLQCVIHINMPKSVQNYIQEIGRAGRRNKRAFCHLFLDPNDYFTERNYFLADELEPQVFEKLIEKMKNCRMKSNIEKKTQSELKRLCLKEDEQKQQIYEEKEQETNKQKITLYSCKCSVLTELCGLKQEAILKILLKIEEVLGKSIFTILPLSYETLKIGFFKSNCERLKQQNTFFSELTQNCKVVKGTTYVDLIKKCNSLSMTPIELLSRVYTISNKQCLKVELINEIFVWKHNTSLKQTLKLLKDTDNFNKIIFQFNEVQKTALTKFNIFYSLCFSNSKKTIQNIIENKQIIPQTQTLPKHSIVQSFDKYFIQQTHQYYKDITKEGGLDQKQTEEAGYLPISEINQTDQQEIYRNVVLFFKHIIPSSSEKDIAKLLKLYRDGRTITRIFLGVNDTNSNWKVYGEHSYWMKFRSKNYKDLLLQVKNGVKKFIEEEAIHYMQIQKANK